ncbi:hypothetical protein ACFFX0_13095 [Citricoccus parietis]|uniref:Uncharacterized protein n=1 Tax=Citricoccus parietis TaxID=592307 RepID=A0ABV5FZG9_9MICC
MWIPIPTSPPSPVRPGRCRTRTGTPATTPTTWSRSTSVARAPSRSWSAPPARTPSAVPTSTTPTSPIC